MELRHVIGVLEEIAPTRNAEAWDNVPLPIGAGQTISQPLVVARMCELLELRESDRVLDVGTGSGYHAAILAELGGRVWSIERDAALSMAQTGLEKRVDERTKALQLEIGERARVEGANQVLLGEMPSDRVHDTARWSPERVWWMLAR